MNGKTARTEILPIDLNTKESSSKDSDAKSGKSQQGKNSSTGSGDWIADVRKSTEEFDQTIRAFIQKRPVTVALSAVGLGLLTSVLVSLMTSKKDET